MTKTSSLVGELANKTTALFATVRKLEGKKADKSEPTFGALQHLLDDASTLIKRLQLEVNQ